MIIEIDECFKKDFQKLKNKEIQKRVIEKLNLMEKVNSLDEITNIKKLKGFTTFYRLRIGDYRIGFEFDGNKILFLRIRSRKDIYNVFP